jgi:4-amino-4-deoxy-L-arabinose transferase-like glycosyltransferase
MALQILLALVGMVCLFSVCFGVGSFLFARFCSARDNSLFATLVKTGLGFGTVGNLIMLMCFCGTASPGAIRGLLIVLFLTSMPLVWMERTALGRHAVLAHALLFARRKLLGWTLLALLAGYLARGLLPPTDFDGLMYHLASAKLFLAHGGFYHIYFNPQSDFPMLTEMNFMIGLAFGNDILCKATSFLFALLACGCIAVLCRRHCQSPRATVPALLVFLTFTGSIANISNCYVDMPLAVWMLLAVLLVEQFRETGLRRHAVLAGIFCGMAMQTKIFGVMVLPLALAQLLLIPQKQTRRGSWADSLALLIPAVTLGLPWYAKSFAHTGTILSIGRSLVVGQGLGNPFGVATHSAAEYWFVNTLGRIAASPWSFSLFARQHQADNFGPLLLAILPFMLFVDVPAGVRRILAWGGIFLAEILVMEMWFIPGGSSIRYSTFVLVLAAPLVVWTVSRLSNKSAVRRILVMMVACMISLGGVLFVKRYYRDWLALATMAPRDTYLASVLPEYAVIHEINSIRDGATVMPVYNFSNYLLDVPYVVSYRSYPDLNEMKRDFTEKNIRYVFGNNTLDTAENRNPFPQIKEKELVAAKNGFYVYRVLW